MTEPTGSTQQLTRQDDRLIDTALQVLSPRWTSSLLIQLFCGKKRTTELLRSLPGLSAKTLSERLKRLQELGLVSRTVYPEVPPRVEYELTGQGAQLLDALLALKSLGQRCAVGHLPAGDGDEQPA
ncbi:MAG TPA: helix-turn-helix domain-containing protein [Candidatus Obscuribacterales bacterium]